MSIDLRCPECGGVNSYSYRQVNTTHVACRSCDCIWDLKTRAVIHHGLTEDDDSLDPTTPPSSNYTVQAIEAARILDYERAKLEDKAKKLGGMITWVQDAMIVDSPHRPQQ